MTAFIAEPHEPQSPSLRNGLGRQQTACCPLDSWVDDFCVSQRILESAPAIYFYLWFCLLVAYLFAAHTVNWSIKTRSHCADVTKLFLPVWRWPHTIRYLPTQKSFNQQKVFLYNWMTARINVLLEHQQCCLHIQSWWIFSFGHLLLVPRVQT